MSVYPALSTFPEPPVARGACPALDRPMETGDGLLIRLSPTRTGLPLPVLKRLGELAGMHGNGLLEITSRGNVQLRGLTATSAGALAEDLAPIESHFRFGLAIDVSPLAGIDPTGDPAAAEIATAIEAGAAKATLEQRLAPKFSIIVDGGGCVDYSALIADIRLQATGEARWTLAVGGTAETARSIGTVDADDAPAAALSLAEAAAAVGPAARGRDLPGEIARRGLEIAAPSFAAQKSVTGTQKITLTIGPNRLGHHEVPVLAPAYGALDAEALIALVAAIAEQATGGEPGLIRVHTLPGRLLAIPGLPEGPARALLDHPASAAFITDPDDPRLGIAACAGKPACASAHVATRALADRLVERGLKTDPARPIHLSGCAKGCARPAGASLHAIGTSAGIELHAVDGRGLRTIDADEDATQEIAALHDRLTSGGRPR